MRDANHSAHPLRPSIEVAVTEKASNKRSHFVLPNARHNQAIASMPQAGVIEARVAGEKSGIVLLARRHPPRFEQQPLSIEDVLVEEDDQA